MVQSLPKSIALEEFLKLPETKPASEYSDGQIVQKPMPQGKHSAIQTEFATTINLALKPKKIANRDFIAQTKSDKGHEKYSALP